uniref:tigger transposable element-derived protein 2-like isoform X4 n=1 Tax=Doryrhamphus excisus TaxID=161450 RepID=UPI0025AE5063|nr:tigger transposable element-derived protein 2-like isoform X4 [Doryrhamphus excisus]
MSTVSLLHKFQSRLTERFTYAAMEIFKEVEHIVRGYQEENERLRFLLYNRRNPRMNSHNIDHNRSTRSATAVREQQPELNTPVELPELPEPLTQLPKMDQRDKFTNISEDEQTEESKPQRSTKDDRPKRKNVMTTIALKKELIAKWECGTRVSDLAIQYNMAKSTISTILKRKEAIKAADVAKGVKTLSSRRSDKVEEVEKVLLEWITHKQLRGDTVSETLICDKARELHNALTRDSPGGSADEFKASKGWFCKFKKRSGIHGVLRPGEAARAEKESNNKFEDEFEDFVDNQDFLS